MTFPITPNPAIHVQPADVGTQQMLYSGGQLSSWAQSLPLAMTLQLMDSILKALGVSQSDIDAYNNDATTYYDAVQTNLATVQTDLTALQTDSTASTAAFGTLLTSWEAAITGYTNWSTFITALETAWTTYSTTESGLTSSAIFTLQNLFDTLLGISPTTGQMAATNVASSSGGSSLDNDLTTFWNWLTGSTAKPSGATTALPAAIPNISAGTGPGQSADLQTNFNNMVEQLLGIPVTSSQAPAMAAVALGQVSNTLVALSSQVQQQQTVQTGAAQYGQSYAAVFNAYPAGAFTSAPFDLAYTGSGTGYLDLANGNANWVGVNNGDVSVVGLYVTGYSITISGTPTSFTLTYNGVTTSAITYSGVTPAIIQTALQALSNMPANNVTVTASSTSGVYDIALNISGTLTGSTSGGGSITTAVTPGFTNTDYQELQATIAGFPNGTGAKNYACLRMNAAMTTYVYGVVYLSSGLTLNWELGCYVAGTHTVFASGTNAPLNFNFTLRAGVGGNPYRFQGVSGSQIVFDYTDSSYVSQVGSAYRGFGFRSDTSNSGQSTPAPAAYIGCADNALPVTQGSGFRMSCSSTTSQSVSVGTNASPPGGSPGYGYFPSGFWDTIDNITPDITPGPSNAYVTIETEGWYLFELRCQMLAVSGNGVVSIYAGYVRNGVFESLANGPSVAVNVFATQWAPTAFGGNCPIYCKAGDTVYPIVYVDTLSTGDYLSALNIFGEANNRLTYWSMTRMFGS